MALLVRVRPPVKVGLALPATEGLRGSSRSGTGTGQPATGGGSKISQAGRNQLDGIVADQRGRWAIVPAKVMLYSALGDIAADHDRVGPDVGQHHRVTNRHTDVAVEYAVNQGIVPVPRAPLLPIWRVAPWTWLLLLEVVVLTPSRITPPVNVLLLFRITVLLPPVITSPKGPLLLSPTVPLR